MKLSESMERLCGVGRPNPNFQRLISYTAPASDEEDSCETVPVPDICPMKIQQESRISIMDKPSENKSLETFIRATFVDVDPVTGGPWLRDKIIYRSSSRKAKPHFSLKRRKKFTNLVAARLRLKVAPEPLKEPLECIESGMKVLWKRGQSTDSCIGPEACRVPNSTVPTELIGDHQPRDSALFK
ncbi:Hypothetical predicted protein [Drosophila guanche]|uniref:Uncharacterized protein n=1 Tax=Drosophila guanche TaxID=7266 RepID=A0A3B0JMT8_DROGU|nr:Hypothetical predicted protein [Drosophila guanche]